MTMALRTPAPFRNLSRLFVAALFCITAMGCGDDGLSPEADLERERALQLWNAQGLDTYTVEVRVVCFCQPALALWQELTIVNDTVIAVRLAEDIGQEILPIAEAEPSFYDSIDALFERMDRAARATDGSRVRAEFNPTTGMPIEVSFLAPPGVADGGATYFLRALKPAVSN